jgi:RNA polymerase sigma factor (sigma-70 family)
VLQPEETRLFVLAAAGGDRAAWDRLVDEYSGLVWSVIRGCGLFGAEAADVSQTVWLRFVEHIDRLREAERAGAWLATTARHECFRVLRRSGRQVVTADVPEVAAPDGADAVVEALAAAADRGAVLVALGRIPPRCQELLRLMAAEPPLTYDDIALSMDVPRGWIGPTRGRCLNHLRRALADDATADRGPGGGGSGIRHGPGGSGLVKEADR